MPDATEIKKLEKKSLVSYIYIGAPVERMQATFGTKARIQLNDAFATVDDITYLLLHSVLLEMKKRSHL